MTNQITHRVGQSIIAPFRVRWPRRSSSRREQCDGPPRREPRGGRAAPGHGRRSRGRVRTRTAPRVAGGWDRESGAGCLDHGSAGGDPRRRDGRDGRRGARDPAGRDAARGRQGRRLAVRAERNALRSGDLGLLTYISSLCDRIEKEEQKMIVQEIELQSADYFEATGRLEMCDECEWHWIGFYFWIDGRGRVFDRIEKDSQEDFEEMERKREELRGLRWELYEIKTKELLDQIQKALKQEDFETALSKRNELHALSDAWNDKANDVWREIDEILEPEMERERERERACWEAGRDNCQIDWDEFDIRRRLMEMEMREDNYNKRKDFYLNYFRGYNKREFFFEQKEWEKRLVQTFRTGGERCDNDEDDDNDGDTDCADSKCQGQRCGYTTIEVMPYDPLQ